MRVGHTQVVSHAIRPSVLGGHIGFRMKVEHIVSKMLDVDIGLPGKISRGRPNIRGKYACKRDMTEAGLK